MKLLALIAPVFLFGCATAVPVVSRFPDVPKELMEKCSELQKLEENAKLSDVAKTVSGNYMEYHKCSSKSDAWIDWYESQKKIHEEIK